MAIPLWPHGAPIDSIWITKAPLNLKRSRQRPTEACLTTSPHAPGRFWRRLVRMSRGKMTWEIVSMLHFTMGDWMFTTGWSLFSCLCSLEMVLTKAGAQTCYTTGVFGCSAGNRCVVVGECFEISLKLQWISIAGWCFCFCCSFGWDSLRVFFFFSRLFSRST